MAFHKGINKEIIISTTKNLIQKFGFGMFSMRLLAETLNVKAASLYTHIESFDSLLRDVGLLALKEQNEILMSSIDGKIKGEAITSLSKSYRKYAEDNIELYKMIMQMPVMGDGVLEKASAMTAEPFYAVLDSYSIPAISKMHWQRTLRAVMHGFITEEYCGYFSHNNVSSFESFDFAIKNIISAIDREEMANG